MSPKGLLKRGRPLTARQKELLFWSVKYTAVFAVFLFVFLPIQGRLSRFSAEKSSLKGRIRDLERISADLLHPREVGRVRAQVEDFEKGLGDVAQAGELISGISRIADKNGLKMIQIFSDSPVSAKDENGRELEVGGRKLQVIPVNFRVQSDYKNIALFLKALSDDPSWTFIVEVLEIQASEAEPEGLQCDMTLGFLVR